MLQRMTKLMEWVTVGVLGLILWISAYSGVALVNQFRTEILWSPVALVFILGVYSVLTIAYRCHESLFVVPLKYYATVLRVATFNDCEDASKELQRQIGEAR